MFSKSIEIYDAIYAGMGKDYAEESARLEAWIQQYKQTPGRALLDVACGTGLHIEHLKKNFQVEGLDLAADMLDIARQRNPGIAFHEGDMVEFDLRRRFDVVVCLFSAIGYARTPDRLVRAMRTMAAHLAPGGVLLVEPWLDPKVFRPGLVHAHYVDEPELKVARINNSELQDGLSVMEMHYLVGTPEGVEYFTELHELGLFSKQQYKDAVEDAGLEFYRDEEGLIGRGMLIGVKPLSPGD
ncbi:MAG: class I SAM-dependent methyltransferase [Anaerolineales bacterium]|nr:class I SAM-dependent methyltransferase [Anaerolineales bacterium]